MPVQYDWRSADAAEVLMQLDQEQFAMEFLRRNPGYKRDYRDTRRRIAEGVLSDEAGMAHLARRWGLSFRA